MKVQRAASALVLCVSAFFLTQEQPGWPSDASGDHAASIDASADSAPNPIQEEASALLRSDPSTDTSSPKPDVEKAAPPPASGPAEQAQPKPSPLPAASAPAKKAETKAAFALKVLERGSRTPIEGAQVVIASTGEEGVSDRTGLVRFEIAPEGTLDLVILANGYQKLAYKGKPKTVFYLTRDLAAIDEIQVIKKVQKKLK